MKLSQGISNLDLDRCFQRWDKQYCEWIATRPVCCKCQEPIIDTDCYMDMDANAICKSCAEDVDKLYLIDID